MSSYEMTRLANVAKTPIDPATSGHQITTNTILTAAGDGYTNALMVIDYAHHEIHSGSHFKSGYQDTTLDTTDTIAVVFTTPDTGKWMHWVLTSQVTGPATIQVFESPTLSAEGTALTPANRNRNSSNTSDMVVKHTPTITTNGTKLSEKWVGSEGFKESSGGSVRGDSEFVLKQDTQYLVLLTAEADSMKGAVGGDWYEHTNNTDELEMIDALAMEDTLEMT